MIYFAQIGEGGPIKIGYTSDVPARMVKLEAHYGAPMILLHVEPGGRSEEQGWHDRFAHLRLDGQGSRGVKPEQFRPAADLMDAIGRPLMVSPNPEAVEVFDPAPNTKTVKMSRRSLAKVKVIAAHRGIPVHELLTELLRGPVDRAFLEMLRRLEGQD